MTFWFVKEKYRKPYSICRDDVISKYAPNERRPAEGTLGRAWRSFQWLWWSTPWGCVGSGSQWLTSVQGVSEGCSHRPDSSRISKGFIFKRLLDEFKWIWWKIKSDAERSCISFPRHVGRLTTIKWRQSMFEIVYIKIWRKYIEKLKHSLEKIRLCFCGGRSPKTGQKSRFH